MVKNHVHGTIGHNKHGSGGVTSSSSLQQTGFAMPDAKRQRLESAGAADVCALLAHVAVSSTASESQVVDGADFSVTVEPQGEQSLEDRDVHAPELRVACRGVRLE